jgi:predicted permease
MTQGFYAKLWAFFYSVVLPLAVGYAAKKITKMPKEKFDILIKINFVSVLPVTAALAFWNMSVTKDLIFLPAIGFVVPLIGAVFGYFVSRKRYGTDNERGSFIVSSMLSNRLNIGGLSAYIIFGEVAFVYINLIILFQAITNYVIGHSIGNFFGNRHKIKNGPTFKALVFRITNISVLGIIVGIILNVSGIPRPEVMAGVLDKLIKVMAWLMLLAVGAAIEFRAAMKYLRDVPLMFLVKFVVLPAFSALFAFLLLKDPIAIATTVILGMGPVAINAVIVAKMNNLNQAVTISAFLTTSTFFLVVIFPILLIVTQYLPI